MQWTSAFSAVRGSDALFPNDFGEDTSVVIETDGGICASLKFDFVSR